MTLEQIKLKRAAGRALWLKRWARRPPAVGAGIGLVRIFSLHDPGWSYAARKYLEDWAANLGTVAKFERLNRCLWPKHITKENSR